MWKKTLAIVMAGVAACSMAACGGGESGGGSQEGTTVIAIANYELGVGRAWLDAATKRFSEKAKGVSYQDGKTGVSFEIQVGSVNSSTMNTSANHIFFDEANSDVRTLAQKGYLMDISDIVTETLTEYNENKEVKQ
jgi:ABC-type glycerol-3-phosphate transport system substrate-binding protein